MKEDKTVLAVVDGVQLGGTLDGHDFEDRKVVEVLTLRGEMWEWDT